MTYRRLLYVSIALVAYVGTALVAMTFLAWEMSR